MRYSGKVFVELLALLTILWNLADSTLLHRNPTKSKDVRGSTKTLIKYNADGVNIFEEAEDKVMIDLESRNNLNDVQYDYPNDVIKEWHPRRKSHRARRQSSDEAENDEDEGLKLPGNKQLLFSESLKGKSQSVDLAMLQGDDGIIPEQNGTTKSRHSGSFFRQENSQFKSDRSIISLQEPVSAESILNDRGGLRFLGSTPFPPLDPLPPMRPIQSRSMGGSRRRKKKSKSKSKKKEEEEPIEEAE